jgi:benzylsuccinate CoA-transferase BbsE subunit
MLTGLRVLDLTNMTGFFCGKVLAEFGINVIKVEKPGGDPARSIGPFYHDIPNAENSLLWLAYNESKKGITLNIDTAKGQDILRKLVQHTDFLIESFPPGYMEKLGLGYEKLSAINSKLIMTSITPFGQTGPYRDYKGSDLIAMAMGGIMLQNGESDGLPCRLDPYHAYCQAGSNAALATLIAYYYREQSGEGQYIDVSISECVIRENYHEVPVAWEFGHYNVKRNGPRIFRANIYTRVLWPCKDGYVTWTMFGGVFGASENKQVAKWMEEEGVIGELNDFNWEGFNFDNVNQEMMNKIEKHFMNLTLKHTKKELVDEARKRRIRISAVADPKDLYENSQLQFRNYWRAIKHPELSDVIVYPGQLFLSDETKAEIRHRAPLIGEHNQEIYQGELGFSAAEIINLKQNGII